MSRKNYSLEEMERFKELVKKHASTIEDKRTDASTTGAKNAAWKTFADEFNSVNSIYRSEASLKNKWKNLKKTIRQDIAKEKKYVSDTGGGPQLPTSLYVNEDDAQIRAIISISGGGIDNTLDEDYIAEGVYTVEQVSSESSEHVPSPSVARKQVPPSAQPTQQHVPSGVQAEKVPSTTHRHVSSEVLDEVSSARQRQIEMQNAMDDFEDMGRDDFISNGLEVPDDTSVIRRNRNKRLLSNTAPGENCCTTGTKRRREYQDKLSSWAAGKAELTELQRKAFNEKVKNELNWKQAEHEMKMSYEKSLYEARVKEINNRLEFERKKMELELKILEKNL